MPSLEAGKYKKKPKIYLVIHNTDPTIISFTGIQAAVQLKKQLGITAQIFESTKDVGGTWHVNRQVARSENVLIVASLFSDFGIFSYPNCACDVPSHLYSLSTEINPSKQQHLSMIKIELNTKWDMARLVATL